jgi:proteasome lid subunit RPN8/RPN11
VVTAAGPLVVPRALADELVAHARAGLPDEACGILSGTGTTVARFHPALNGDPSPFRYSIDSADLLRIVTEIEDADEDVLAIYHSHTQSPAFPSRTDVQLAFWPDAAYLIVSLATDPPDLKAFSIRDGKIGRRELQLRD